MINIDPTILFIMGEVIIALVVVMAGLIIVMFKARKRDRDAATKLQVRLKRSEPDRQAWYENVLEKSIENGDADANRELAKSWVENESRVNTQIVDMYMKRNSEALLGLDKLLHEHSSAYIELISLMRARLEEQQQSVPDEVREQLERLAQESEQMGLIVETLKQDNQRLSSELAGANKEIDQAMSEYSVAFRPGSGMTGSAGPVAAGVTVAAAGVAGLLDVEEPETMRVSAVLPASVPEMDASLSAVLEADIDEPWPETAADASLAEGLGSELDELTSEIMAETGAIVGANESAVVEEMDLDQWSETEAMPVAESGLVEDSVEAAVESPVDESVNAWRDSFDELPDAAEVAEKSETIVTKHAKGPVIDLSDEGGIVLPELNGLVATADEDMEELLAGDELPVLDEGVEKGVLDEERLLAQLEGLDDIELPLLSSGMDMDEMTDLELPPAKVKEVKDSK